MLHFLTKEAIALVALSHPPKRMRIYIAAPYSKGDVAVNIRNAIIDGDYVAHLGHIPFIPHLTHFWHLVQPHDYEFWLEQDMQWLRVCNALLRRKGESSGADKEVAEAERLGLQIFHSVFDIPKIG